MAIKLSLASQGPSDLPTAAFGVADTAPSALGKVGAAVESASDFLVKKRQLAEKEEATLKKTDITNLVTNALAAFNVVKKNRERLSKDPGASAAQLSEAKEQYLQYDVGRSLSMFQRPEDKSKNVQASNYTMEDFMANESFRGFVKQYYADDAEFSANTINTQTARTNEQFINGYVFRVNQTFDASNPEASINSVIDELSSPTSYFNELDSEEQDVAISEITKTFKLEIGDYLDNSNSVVEVKAFGEKLRSIRKFNKRAVSLTGVQFFADLDTAIDKRVKELEDPTTQRESLRLYNGRYPKTPTFTSAGNLVEHSEALFSWIDLYNKEDYSRLPINEQGELAVKVNQAQNTASILAFDEEAAMPKFIEMILENYGSNAGEFYGKPDASLLIKMYLAKEKIEGEPIEFLGADNLKMLNNIATEYMDKLNKGIQHNNMSTVLAYNNPQYAIEQSRVNAVTDYIVRNGVKVIPPEIQAQIYNFKQLHKEGVEELKTVFGLYGVNPGDAKKHIMIHPGGVTPKQATFTNQTEYNNYIQAARLLNDDKAITNNHEFVMNSDASLESMSEKEAAVHLGIRYPELADFFYNRATVEIPSMDEDEKKKFNRFKSNRIKEGNNAFGMNQDPYYKAAQYYNQFSADVGQQTTGSKVYSTLSDKFMYSLYLNDAEGGKYEKVLKNEVQAINDGIGKYVSVDKRNGMYIHIPPEYHKHSITGKRIVAGEMSPGFGEDLVNATTFITEPFVGMTEQQHAGYYQGTLETLAAIELFDYVTQRFDISNQEEHFRKFLTETHYEEFASAAESVVQQQGNFTGIINHLKDAKRSDGRPRYLFRQHGDTQVLYVGSVNKGYLPFTFLDSEGASVKIEIPIKGSKGHQAFVQETVETASPLRYGGFENIVDLPVDLVTNFNETEEDAARAAAVGADFLETGLDLSMKGLRTLLGYTDVLIPFSGNTDFEADYMINAARRKLGIKPETTVDIDDVIDIGTPTL
jgi:hypothetical protein